MLNEGMVLTITPRSEDIWFKIHGDRTIQRAHAGDSRATHEGQLISAGRTPYGDIRHDFTGTIFVKTWLLRAWRWIGHHAAEPASASHTVNI
jgi:hypothetical protein